VSGILRRWTRLTILDSRCCRPGNRFPKAPGGISKGTGTLPVPEIGHPWSRYLRRGPLEESFDCQLPPGARSELLEEIPLPKTYRLREIPTYQPAPEPSPEFVLRPPPPLSPPRPPVMPGAARPAQRASPGRSGTGIWLLLGVLALSSLRFKCSPTPALLPGLNPLTSSRTNT